MFLYNNWYVAAFGHDLAPLRTLSRRVCDQPIVLYRTSDGVPVALEDRCSHRSMPLSLDGQCTGNTIRCPYHGLRFGANGQCIEIPTQIAVPERSGIRAFPLVERDGSLWIWMGSAELANPDLIPPHRYHADANYTWDSFMVEFQASWLLVLDNLCDMTHIAFVHSGINGDTGAQLTASLKVTPHGKNGVKLERRLPNSIPPAHYVQLRGFWGRVDRWQEIIATPNLARFWTGATDVGTGAYEGNRSHGLNIHSYHAITPKTATSCYYHFSNARDFALGDKAVSAKLSAGARQTIDVEDRPVIEAQQRRILDDPTRPFVDLQTDAAGVQLRRIIERMALAERAPGHGQVA